jgi:hypothetical protein
MSHGVKNFADFGEDKRSRRPRLLCHLDHGIRKDDDAQFKVRLVIDMAGVKAY